MTEASAAILDLYCERTNAAFWSEPFNALTNVVFLVAAVSATRLLLANRFRIRGEATLWLLLVLAVGIAVGSFLFHTLATPWAAAADVIPIALFSLTALGALLTRFFGFTPFMVGAVLLAFLALSALVTAVIPSAWLNGSESYLPILGMLYWLGTKLRRSDEIAGRHLLVIANTFAVSLLFRTVDQLVCDAVPIGTHFLWHLLNGSVVYGILAMLIDRSTRWFP